MRILLPVDSSPYSQEAARSLATEFQTRGVQVDVLNVVEPLMMYMSSGMVPEPVVDTAAIEAERHKQAKALVAATAATLRQAGFEVTESVTGGDAKSQILDHAEKWGADLIILGSHGLKGLARFVMGSVSEAVMRHAKCSVQIVRLRKTNPA